MSFSFMQREYPRRFQSILDRIATKIPGINQINTERSPDGRLLLRFDDRGFQDPFYSQQMSDGTLKVFAYLLLLENRSPFLCVEEPENGLYHKLLKHSPRSFERDAAGLSSIRRASDDPIVENMVNLMLATRMRNTAFKRQLNQPFGVLNETE